MSDTVIIVRAATPSDAKRILSIQKAAFSRYVGPLRREQIPPLHETARELKNDLTAKSLLLAEYDGTIAGSVRYAIRGGVCHIERLSVLPSLQKRNIGRTLLETVEQACVGRAHKLYLETGLLAANLVPFYAKLGFFAEARFASHYGEFDWIAFAKFTRKPRQKACDDADTLSRIRGEIDILDQTIVCLLAARGACVSRAARFKRSASDVRGESRRDDVIRNVRKSAQHCHADPDTIEGIYRTVIEHFIHAEMREYAQISGPKAGRHA
jgi:isochorismate pyruvate lyase